MGLLKMVLFIPKHLITRSYVVPLRCEVNRRINKKRVCADYLLVISFEFSSDKTENLRNLFLILLYFEQCSFFACLGIKMFEFMQTTKYDLYYRNEVDIFL